MNVSAGVARGHARLNRVLAVLIAGATGIFGMVAAHASTVTSATFAGGAGTVTVDGTVYAKRNGALTLTVATSSETQCVDLAGAHTGHQQSDNPKSSWTFAFTAPAGDGVQAVTVTASPNHNGNDKCTGKSGSAQASYVLDNTGPSVDAALSPRPNGAQWNNSNVSITWTADDPGGSGVATDPTPAADGVNANTAGVTKSATATDRLGNAGNGSVTVKLDKTAPIIEATRTPAPNAAGWNNTNVAVSFTCSDGLSGIKSCTGGGSVLVTTEGAGQSVPGTAIDNADNANSAGVTGINIDKTAPTLTGAPTSAANTHGWHRGDVTIRWSASDALSGLVGGEPPDSTIGGEGTGLKATASVSDKAGNGTTADSSSVKIDRTAPTTGISGTSNNWTNGDVTVGLSSSDNLSGVASTTYAVDGGPQQTGTSVALSSEGDHTVTYFSTDLAGNAEQARTTHVKIDKTAPSIGHTFTPTGYTDGAWTNQSVTVTFVCEDAGSGVASCTAPVTEGTEGAGQPVVGTAIDGAGNSATNTALVSIDKTPPTVTAARDRAPNGAGWYNDDVTVSFTADDALSGVARQSAAKVLGEGENQMADGTATDAAGNSASAGVTAINVDKTAPTLTALSADGWHAADVTVDWSCSDALSGVPASGEPADVVVTGEGEDLSSTASCTDRAGNPATETVRGIRIDRTAPTTRVVVPDPLTSGWYAGPVDVTLTGLDALSGVDKTFFSVDGGPAQPYSGALSFGQKGQHTIAYWSVDVAGNVEDRTGNQLTLKIDGKAPTTTVVNPISPASGWFVTSGIPVAFEAADGESGVAATHYRVDGGESHVYGEPFTADLSDGVHTITYWSVDIAGNEEAEQTAEVKIDTVPPTITGWQTPAANGLGWNNTDVAVTFDCDDAGSHVQTGVAGCAGGTTLTNEGAGQQVHGDAVDVAGNTSGTDYGPVHIDKTKPTLSGAPTADANGAGWYTDDVTVRWTGDDKLSGIEDTAQPKDDIITGEGRNLGVGPVTVEDRAGNVSDPATVGGIKIDRTAPVISGAATTEPNGAGWYKRGVVVDFRCTDNLSGVASCPTSQVLDQDGADQSVGSGPATDMAGNERAGITVGGINVDGTAPTTTADNQCTRVNSWCTGSTASVVLAASDQDGLSGVKELHYRVDGGAEQVAPGVTTTVSVALDGSGAGAVSYWAVDVAGNVEAENSVSLKWDNIAPTVTHTLRPAANANDWNSSDVTVRFEAKDDDNGSGVDWDSVGPDVLVDTETGGQLVRGSAKDTAGNEGSDQVMVRLDKTRPTISAAVVSGATGNDGWYVGPVTVHFTCSDALSGIATCPGDVTLTSSGENDASGTATDKAGNLAWAGVTGIRIDREQPTIDDVNVAGRTFTLGAVPLPTCTASDIHSGLAGCAVTVTGGRANGVGTFTYAATATDRAGNGTTRTGTYKVIYRFDGFLQPINDTAHQVGTSTSVFKAGSTVPAKLQLKKADGTVVSANVAPGWLAPAKGSATSAPVEETAYTVAADSGATYRYDSQERQYAYNWKTGNAGGSYWRMGVVLDDGQTYYVNIGLR